MTLKVEAFAPLIQVFDMPTSLAFYRDVLGFQVVMQSAPGEDFDWGLLRLGNIELMLNTAYEKEHRPPAPDPARVAAHGDTALFFGCGTWTRRTHTSAPRASM
jgi:catechol 2,3-dioxygenase-like lactoylglutathione lyase family enzyme